MRHDCTALGVARHWSCARLQCYYQCNCVPFQCGEAPQSIAAMFVYRGNTVPSSVHNVP